MRPCAPLLLIVFAAASLSDASARPREASGLLIPSTVRSYPTASAIMAESLFQVSEPSENLTLRHAVSASAFQDGASTEERGYWPVLLSALVPGTGELALGYKLRGASLLALEVIGWTGYFRKRDEGLETRSQYESFADENWDQQKWADDHPDLWPTFTGFTPAEMDSVGRDKSGNEQWPGYILWVSKEEDKQHYYENIGKYGWYLSGWEDYRPDATTQMFDTPLRDEYRALRQESNGQLDDANKFLYINLAARVVSVIDTYLIIRKSNNALSAPKLDNHLSFRATPMGYSGAEFALEYRFK